MLILQSGLESCQLSVFTVQFYSRKLVDEPVGRFAAHLLKCKVHVDDSSVSVLLLHCSSRLLYNHKIMRQIQHRAYKAAAAQLCSIAQTAPFRQRCQSEIMHLFIHEYTLKCHSAATVCQLHMCTYICTLLSLLALLSLRLSDCHM